MERKYLIDLINWDNDKNRKPLLVLGARQVGKSYLIEELFAKKYYKDKYLRIDCSDDKKFVEFVNENSSLDDTLVYLSLNYNFVPDGEHLLIIDEAQECLPIIKMMKHFCERKRNIPLIVSGSLVRIKISRLNKNNEGFLFPVGKINMLYIFPLTFDEFLFNYDKNVYKYVKEHFENDIPIGSQEIHNNFLDIFKEYLFVGGMPEVVDVYLKNKNDKVSAIKKVIKNLDEIYETYLSDMELYQASRESIVRTQMIFKNIYSQLNKENKNFKYSLIESGLRNRDMLNPLAWLITSNIVIESSLLKERVTTPLTVSDENMMRLYLSDMGLFTYQSKANASDFLLNTKNTLSGIFFENYIASELHARRIKLFYWKGKRNSELEFLININSSAVPIEVKKGRGSISSLEEYKLHNTLTFAIKVSSNQYGYDSKNKILTIPFYYFSFYLNKTFSK